MREDLLKQIRDKILKKEYVMVEEIILSGTIHERQKDSETAEWKYRILGKTTLGQQAAVVVKLSLSRKVVIITVYKD